MPLLTVVRGLVKAYLDAAPGGDAAVSGQESLVQSLHALEPAVYSAAEADTRLAVQAFFSNHAFGGLPRMQQSADELSGVLYVIGRPVATGAQGPAGPKGDKGDKGDSGAVGAQGPAGPSGAAGPQGVAGAAGSPGPQGETGAQGPQGPQGPIGPAGADGATGPQGPQGPAGATGATGSAGPQGPSGSDAWTYVRLTSDFTTTSTANSDSPLAFIPAGNTLYEIEGRFFLQADAITTGPRPGIAWPTGSQQEAAWMMAPTSATAFVSRLWGAPSAANAASTGIAVANEGYYGQVSALLRMGALPSGNFRITLASEIAGSTVRLMANSFIRYRAVP